MNCDLFWSWFTLKFIWKVFCFHYLDEYCEVFFFNPTLTWVKLKIQRLFYFFLSFSYLLRHSTQLNFLYETKNKQVCLNWIHFNKDCKMLKILHLNDFLNLRFRWFIWIIWVIVFIFTRYLSNYCQNILLMAISNNGIKWLKSQLYLLFN